MLKIIVCPAVKAFAFADGTETRKVLPDTELGLGV
jgi:hypothetical protein